MNLNQQNKYNHFIGTSNEEEIINLVASGKKSTRINPYDLLLGDVVGEGSFGIVYRGIYKNTYDVAVKKVFVYISFLFSFTTPSFF